MPAKRMKPALCVRNDRDDTLGIAASVLNACDVPTRRLFTEFAELMQSG